ncbi:unnamed protein product [Aphanomyces euteiches]
MEAEETSQRIHQQWVEANAKSDAIFAKKKRILEERRRLMEDIKQEMEQEALEKELQEREEREAKERSIAAWREMEDKQWRETMQNMTDEQKEKLLCHFFTRTGSMHTIGVRSNADGDDNLELGENEMQEAYKGFYFDALKELLKFGNVVQLTTCRNTASHLRGNVYVEFQSAQQVSDAFVGLQGRWYAGKQV